MTSLFPFLLIMTPLVVLCLLVLWIVRDFYRNMKRVPDVRDEVDEEIQRLEEEGTIKVSEHLLEDGVNGKN